MEFGIEKCSMLGIKSDKRHLTDGMELPNQEKRKPTNIWGYWKLTPSHKWRWKKKLRKNSSGQRESNSRKTYVTETLSKEFIPELSSRKIFGTILQSDHRRTKTNRPEKIKLMTMHKALHSRDDVDRFDLSRKKEESTWQYWRQYWHINTTTWRLNTKARRKTDYSHWKHYWQRGVNNNNTGQHFF